MREKTLFNDTFDKKMCAPVAIFVFLGRLFVKPIVPKSYFLKKKGSTKEKLFLTMLLTLFNDAFCLGNAILYLVFQCWIKIDTQEFFSMWFLMLKFPVFSTLFSWEFNSKWHLSAFIFIFLLEKVVNVFLNFFKSWNYVFHLVSNNKRNIAVRHEIFYQKVVV